MTEHERSARQGVFFALGAYGMWGFAPIYYKLLTDISPWEILSHRVLWSLLFSVALVLLFGLWPKVRAVLRSAKQVRYLVATSLLVSFNWGLFIWAVNNDYMLDASLGYYINPLVNVLLGMVFLGERLRRWQWLALGLAMTGVVLEVINIGSLPLISLGLAGSFGIYALLRKKVKVDSTTGMLLETSVVLPLALAYLWLVDSPTSYLPGNSWQFNLLLVCAGPVTMAPLMSFAAAATRLRLSTLGFFQYLGPSLMFVLAVTLYDEPLSSQKLVTFLFIWAALVVFSVDGLRSRRKAKRQPVAESA